MTATPRIALVGAGSMGRNHARIIAESSGADLAVIVDPFEASARPVAERFGATWAPDLSGLSGIDAVVIAASTEHHYGIATEVIALGLPLLVEKPICPSLSQTTEILDAAERAGVPIMCGFLERFNPAVVVARRMVEEPVLVRAQRHSPYTPRIRTGVAWDLLVHDVDLIAQFFGGTTPDTTNVEVGFFHPESADGAEDIIEASFSFAGGAIASASASRLGQLKVRSMVVQSLDSMVEIDLLRRGVTSYRHTTIEFHEERGPGFRQATEMEVPEIVGREPLAAQFDRFLELLAGTADMDEERRSIVPAHRIIDHALSQRPASA